MRLNQCVCGPHYYVRIPRTWWMRLFAARRLHYGCEGCGATLFIPPPAGVWDPEATVRKHASDFKPAQGKLARDSRPGTL